MKGLCDNEAASHMCKSLRGMFTVSLHDETRGSLGEQVEDGVLQGLHVDDLSDCDIDCTFEHVSTDAPSEEVSLSPLPVRLSISVCSLACRALPCLRYYVHLALGSREN